MDRRIKYTIILVMVILSFMVLILLYEWDIYVAKAAIDPNTTTRGHFEVYSTSEVYDLSVYSSGIGLIKIIDPSGQIKTLNFTSSGILKSKIRFHEVGTIDVIFTNLDNKEVSFEFNLVYHPINVDRNLFLLIGMLASITIIGCGYFILNNGRWSIRKKTLVFAEIYLVITLGLQLYFDPDYFIKTTIDFLIGFMYVLLYTTAAFLFFVLFLRNRGKFDPLKLVDRTIEEPGNPAFMLNIITPIMYGVLIYLISFSGIKITKYFVYITLAILPTLILITAYYIFRGVIALGYFHSTPGGFGLYFIKLCVIIMFLMLVIVIGIEPSPYIIFIPILVTMYGILTYPVLLIFRKFGILVSNSDNTISVFIVTFFEFEGHSSIHKWLRESYSKLKSRNMQTEM